ncbi:MAG: PAS domain-containing protein, partial [Opitutaceae bacterium]
MISPFRGAKTSFFLPGVALCSAAIGWGYLATVRAGARATNSWIMGAAVVGAVSIGVVLARRSLKTKVHRDACEAPPAGKKDCPELSSGALVALNTSAAIMVTNSLDKIEWVNAAFSTMTGYTLEEAAGLHPREFLQGPDTDLETVAYLRDCFMRQVAFETEILNYDKNARAFWVHLSGNPVFDSSGRFTHFVTLQTDVTKRRQRESLNQSVLTHASH